MTKCQTLYVHKYCNVCAQFCTISIHLSFRFLLHNNFRFSSKNSFVSLLMNVIIANKINSQPCSKVRLYIECTNMQAENGRALDGWKRDFFSFYGGRSQKPFTGAFTRRLHDSWEKKKPCSQVSTISLAQDLEPVRFASRSRGFRGQF